MTKRILSLFLLLCVFISRRRSLGPLPRLASATAVPTLHGHGPGHRNLHQPRTPFRPGWMP